MEELKRTLALLFRRKGRDRLTEKEFVFSASMDLRWFSPKEAQRLLRLGLEARLLEAEDGELRPTFDVDGMVIPLDFVPSGEVLATPPPSGDDLLASLVAHIVAATGRDRKDVVAKVNEVQEEMDVDVEVAALLGGMAMGADMTSFLDAVEQAVRARPR
jgi:hypothetical protein